MHLYCIYEPLFPFLFWYLFWCNTYLDTGGQSPHCIRAFIFFSITTRQPPDGDTCDYRCFMILTLLKSCRCLVTSSLPLVCKQLLTICQKKRHKLEVENVHLQIKSCPSVLQQTLFWRSFLFPVCAILFTVPLLPGGVKKSACSR